MKPDSIHALLLMHVNRLVHVSSSSKREEPRNEENGTVGNSWKSNERYLGMFLLRRRLFSTFSSLASC